MLRALYAYAKRTDMDPEQGRREKGKIEEAVRRRRADYELARYRAEQMKVTGVAMSDYRKARNAMGSVTALYLPPEVVAALVAADRIAEALDNIPIERGEADEKRD